MESDSKIKNEDDKFDRKVLVSNLPSIYDESDVRSLFANVGTVISCSLNQNNLDSTSSSVVEFSSVNESQKALTLSGVSVRYHILKISRINETPNDESKKDMKLILEEAKEKIEKAIKERNKNKGNESKKTESSSNYNSESSDGSDKFRNRYHRDSDNHYRSRRRHHRHSSYSRSPSISRTRTSPGRSRRRRSRSSSRSMNRHRSSKDRFGRTRKSRYKGSRSSSTSRSMSRNKSSS